MVGAKANKTFTMKSMSAEQWAWLRGQAEKLDVSMSVVIKMLIQSEIDKEIK